MKRVQLQLDLFGDPADLALSESALRHMLEALTIADQIYLRAHPDAPSPFEAGERLGLRYGAEPRGEENWNAIPYVLERASHGLPSDCEDLAAYLTAYLRERVPGMQGATTVPLPPKLIDGTTLLYHIVTELPDGRILDPSRALGMGT